MLLTAALLMLHFAQAQTIYPIRSIATLSGTAPYTLDGFVSQEGKFQVYLFIDDAAINQHAVKLRLTLQSSDVKISTTAAYKPAPIFLDGGTMQTLTSLDLAPLFSLNNLNFEGYTKSQYQKAGRLPEGVYRISVDVLDYYRNVVISKSTAAIGMMYLTKAPLLTFPVDKSEVDILTSPQIRFSWMTYQAANPAAEVVHRFRLWEVKPAGRNANEVTTVMSPIYEEEVTGASVIINPDQLLLTQGSWYVWQVQAVDLQNQVIYQNSGKSQVMTFRYGKSCNTPDPRIVKVTNTGADIAWDGNLTTRQYKVSYRLAGATEWTTDITTLSAYSFKQLTDNSTYECTVTALCSSEESEPSEILQFKTNRTVNYACGTGEGKFDLSNTEPLASLSRFEEFKAADFIVEANEVTGSDGTFSGTGYVLVPYLSFMKMMVTFKNITINSDHRMISGQIEFVYDEATGMVGTVYRDKTTTAGAAEQFLAEGGDKVITTTQPITNVIVNNNTVTITLQDGSTQTVTVDKKGDTVAIASSDGKTAYVADTGSGMVFTTPVPGSSEAANSSAVATPAQSGIYGCSVDIKPIVNPSGGFDAVGNGINKPNNYFLSSKAGKPIAWKSLPAGGTDYVQVEVKGNCAIDSLRYLRASGLPVPSTPSGRGKRLLLTGTSDGDEEVLTVALSTKKLQPDSTYSQTLTEAGALGLVSYEPLKRDVYIVPVNGAVTPAYAPAIKTVLDQLYAPAQVSWNVTIKANIEVDNITADGFNTTDLALARSYTTDMNKVIRAWKKANHLPAKTVVLFFVNANNSDKLGYMPLAGDYGFIFKLGSNVELMGHELAHGTFNLKHTFSDKAFWRESGKAPIFAEKTTQNLMDYANGTELWKYQWDLIHHPQTIAKAALDEDEGAKWWCNAYPPRNIVNPQEGQHEITYGQDHCVDNWYYFSGGKLATGESIEAGWLEEKSNYIEKTREYIKYLAILNGDVYFINKQQKEQVLEIAENRLAEFFGTRIISPDFWTLVKEFYPEIRTEADLYYSGSGKIDVVTPEFDVFLEFTALGMIKDVVNAMRLKSMLKYSTQISFENGRFLDAQKNVIADITSGELKNLNFIPSGGNVVGQSTNAIKYNTNNAIANDVLLLIEKDGKFGFRVGKYIETESIGRLGDILISSVSGDIRKFSEYALVNPTKTGLFVDSWGYKLTDAENLLSIYKSQAIQAVKDGNVIFVRTSEEGIIYRIETVLSTPNKGQQKFYSGWILKGNDLQLVTPFAKEIK